MEPFAPQATLAATPPPAVGRALEAAIRRSQRVLFYPPLIERWLAIGLGAFLAGLLQGQTDADLEIRGGQAALTAMRSVARQGPAALADATWWGPASAWGLAALLLWGLVLFLRSRGRFIFVYQVARETGQVLTPWHALRRQADALLAFDLLVAVTLVGLAGLWLILAAATGPTLPALETTLWVAPPAIAAVALVALRWIVNDLLVPTMYAHRAGVLEGFAILYQKLLRPYPSRVLLFYGTRLGLVLLLTVAMGIIALLTCALGALPYISSVLLLPALVVLRAFPMSLLEQLGPEWRPLAAPHHPARCPYCAYALGKRHSLESCPECHMDLTAER